MLILIQYWIYFYIEEVFYYFLEDNNFSSLY